ncbi:MAG: 16S rRNA (cytidine(1402)-2'-O)-methyltransferase [candidate division Zixibacteria bacterium]|nr:16S rRNA (cytidine(1402)-2'-O)-methyltransferase [candidate division Zixibacteria bacterium]
MKNEFPYNKIEVEKVSPSGKLYLVSTPIGNLEDITLRALRILKEVDLIAAEDTRHTPNLLRHYQIKNKLTSYHDFNEEKTTKELINLLKQGKSVALVSDAGTPGISDPAYLLVKSAIQENIEIIPIPGPTALISALVVSGLPTDRFVFEGFLPSKEGKRKRRLGELTDEKRTIILYESPHRLLKSLHRLKESLGDRNVVLARELTKKFEEIKRGKISQLIDYFTQKKIKGEIVILVEGKT